MKNYGSAMQKHDGYQPYASPSSYGESVSHSFSNFSIELARPYPSIQDELKKDVAILKSSLEVRDEYIDRLREARDSLIKELRVHELVLECQEHRIRSYQEFFNKNEKNKESGIASD